MSKESIVDATVPSAGRIYDFLLGGHHNFEVDRQAANRMLAILPFLTKTARLQRWCLQDIANELTGTRGFDAVVDFASGLPTQDHIHTVVPAGTTVIYSDYDPVVVEYAREILGSTPNVYFYEADARHPEQLLNNPEVVRILASKRKVALIYWGIAVFLVDDEVKHVARTLYDWSDASGCWVFNAQGADANAENPAAARVIELYRQTGTPVHVRTKERYLDLIKPWHPDSTDFISLLEWHGFDQSELSKEDRDAFGPTGAGYGAYLIK
jgi:hypothetical protein